MEENVISDSEMYPCIKQDEKMFVTFRIDFSELGPVKFTFVNLRYNYSIN